MNTVLDTMVKHEKTLAHFLENEENTEEISQLIDNPEFLGELIKDLNIDPEDEVVKNLIEAGKEKEGDAEKKDDGAEGADEEKKED